MTAWDKEHSNQWWCQACHTTHDSPDCPVEPQKCSDYINDIDQVRGKIPLDSPGTYYFKAIDDAAIPMPSGISAPVNTSDVDHPEHYSRWEMEPIEFVAINNLPWWLHAVIKYTMRYDAKDGLKDMYKARSYLDMKIRQLEGVKRFWEKPVAEERKLNRETR